MKIRHFGKGFGTDLPGMALLKERSHYGGGKFGNQDYIGILTITERQVRTCLYGKYIFMRLI